LLLIALLRQAWISFSVKTLVVTAATIGPSSADARANFRVQIQVTVEHAITRQLFYELTAGVVLDVPSSAPLCQANVNFPEAAARLTSKPYRIFEELPCRPIRAVAHRVGKSRFLVSIKSNVFTDCPRLKTSAEAAWTKYLSSPHLLRLDDRMRPTTIEDLDSRRFSHVPREIPNFVSARYPSFSMTCRDAQLEILISR
jgi:hypothetical protein